MPLVRCHKLAIKPQIIKFDLRNVGAGMVLQMVLYRKKKGLEVI